MEEFVSICPDCGKPIECDKIKGFYLRVQTNLGVVRLPMTDEVGELGFDWVVWETPVTVLATQLVCEVVRDDSNDEIKSEIHEIEEWHEQFIRLEAGQSCYFFRNDRDPNGQEMHDTDDSTDDSGEPIDDDDGWICDECLAELDGGDRCLKLD